MINREITYKRDINNSYMIVPAMPEENFDEARMLKNRIENLLSVEKCYIGGVGQYWYNISGKQALDAYCRVHSISRDFFEKLILKLCRMVEALEWSLIDTNCLVLDPELVFLNSQGEEVYFAIYPFHKGELATELQQLLEFLLTKLDHKDATVVGWAYKLYEMSLVEGVSITELKRVILEERERSIELPKKDEYVLEIQPEEFLGKEIEKEQERESFLKQTMEKLRNCIWEKVKPYYDKGSAFIQKVLPKEAIEKEERERPVIVYPEEPEEAVNESAHPTVCLASKRNQVRELRCESHGLYPDFVLGMGSYVVGKSTNAQFRIPKDTVSQFHARIEWQGEAHYIEDLNSTNGTYVNEVLLNYRDRRRLEPGDRVLFGDVTYYYS